MFLIASAAYIDNEFKAELGSLPPAFLPISNRRLFELQVENIRKLNNLENIYLSLPKSFYIDQKDVALLTTLDVSVLRMPDGLSIGESILTALEELSGEGPVRILYGDTLISDLPALMDCVAISETNDHYDWMIESSDIDKELVWSGFFSFGSIEKLLSSLRQNNFSFIEAVRYLLSIGEIKKHKVYGWFDLGHINTYFQARSKLTTERSFNSLKIENNVVTKKSSDVSKILAEANWFKTIPSSIKRLTPNFIELNESSEPTYSIEYLYYMPLNELAVHGKLPLSSWKVVLEACKEYFNSARMNELSSNSVLLKQRQELIVDKTYKRIQAFIGTSPVKVDVPVVFNGKLLPSIVDIVSTLIKSAEKSSPIFSPVHGDFCFSNILFDSRARSVKLIDPRGISDSGEVTIYGDLTYDLAKFYHSAIGFYDFIISGCYELELNNQNIEFEIHVSEDMLHLKELLVKVNFLPDYKEKDVFPLVILLFFSMLPLHSDNYDRQCALLANALRLYVDYKGM